MQLTLSRTLVILGILLVAIWSSPSQTFTWQLDEMTSLGYFSMSVYWPSSDCVTSIISMEIRLSTSLMLTRWFSVMFFPLKISHFSVDSSFVWSWAVRIMRVPILAVKAMRRRAKACRNFGGVAVGIIFGLSDFLTSNVAFDSTLPCWFSDELNFIDTIMCSN